MAPGVPSQAVYAERIKNAQEAMKQQGIDVLLVGPSSDLVYLIGYDAHLSERLNLLIIRQEGTPDLVVPVLESFLAKGSEPNVTLRRWEETESPSELAASLIGDTNGVTLGVSDQLWSTFLLKLQKAMPAGDWTTGQPILAHLRVTKDQSELDNLFEVARLTDEAWHEFVESGQLSGLTEAQAMERLSGMMEKRGLGRSFGICASGPNAASPHHHTGNRVIQQGDSVIFDWGGTLNGYHSDVTRTVFVGTPTDEYRKVYETVKAGESGGARCGQARRSGRIDRQGCPRCHHQGRLRSRFPASGRARARHGCARGALSGRWQYDAAGRRHGLLGRAGHLSRRKSGRADRGFGGGHRNRRQAPQ